MAKLLKLRRGTDTQHSTFTGAEGEVTVNTTNDSLHVHDGSTAGGHELARADLSNVDNTTIVNGTSNVSVAASGDITLTRAGVTTFETISNGARVKGGEGGQGILEILSDEGDDLSDKFRLVANDTGPLFIQGDGGAGWETNIRCVANGSTELYHNNNLKVETTSTGINVTGTVDCDGITINGNGTLSGGDLAIGSSTDTSVFTRLDFEDSGGIGFVNLNAHGTADFKFLHNRTGSSNTGIPNSSGGIATNYAVPIYFANSATPRAYFDTNGNFRPAADDTYDLGSPSEQWQDGYFDGTVYCDGLQCDGTATISSGTGVLKIQDSNSTGNAAENYIYGANSDNSTRWYLGQASSSVQDLYVQNQASAAIRFGTNGTARAYVTASGHFIPANNNTYDLGDTSNRWRNVYTNDLNLSNEGSANDVDGTWGSWTIQEGEDDLFLLNRRNGKKYKFNLSEVN